jgi:hypothetical protein
MWSGSAPVADCPASFSHSPGSIAPKYGARAGLGVAPDAAMWQVDGRRSWRCPVEFLRGKAGKQTDATGVRVA